MAESTLNLAKADLWVITSDFMGWGLGAANGDVGWNQQQQYRLQQIVNEACRIVYFPEPEQAGGPAYDWSFLHPTATLLLPAGAQSILLPDDFAGWEGAVTLLSSTVFPVRIPVVSEPYLRQLYQAMPAPNTGPPEYVAIAPQRMPSLSTGTIPAAGSTQYAYQSQRNYLAVYPQADIQYTLQGQYYLIPEALSDSWPYVYGGAEHASTFRAACLKVAENFLDDTRRGDGPHSIEFKQRISASIGMDRKKKPQSGGLNTDSSDALHMNRWAWHAYGPAATYMGQECQ